MKLTAERIDDPDYGPYWKVVAEDEDGNTYSTTEGANRRDPKSLEDLYRKATRPMRPSERVMTELSKGRPPQKRPDHHVEVQQDYLYDRKDDDPVTYGWMCRTCRQRVEGYPTEDAAKLASEGHMDQVLAWREAHGVA